MAERRDLTSWSWLEHSCDVFLLSFCLIWVGQRCAAPAAAHVPLSTEGHAAEAAEAQPADAGRQRHRPRLAVQVERPGSVSGRHRPMDVGTLAVDLR